MRDPIQSWSILLVPCTAQSDVDVDRCHSVLGDDVLGDDALGDDGDPHDGDCHGDVEDAPPRGNGGDDAHGFSNAIQPLSIVGTFTLYA